MIWGIVVCISRFKTMQPETPEHKETYRKDEGQVTAVLSGTVVVQVLACFLPVLPCSVFDCTCVQLFASSTPCYVRAHVPTAAGNIWNEHCLQRRGVRARWGERGVRFRESGSAPPGCRPASLAMRVAHGGRDGEPSG